MPELLSLQLDAGYAIAQNFIVIVGIHLLELVIVLEFRKKLGCLVVEDMLLALGRCLWLCLKESAFVCWLFHAKEEIIVVRGWLLIIRFRPKNASLTHYKF